MNVGPGPDGTLEDTAYDRLREIGDWMQVNSEGIYATKAVEPYQDGQVYYTAKGDYVYAFYIPEEGEEAVPAVIKVPSFRATSSKGVQLMGSKKPLKWVTSPEGGKNPPCDHIYCLKIKVK